MKKKVIALVLASSVLFGGVAGAASSYFTSQIADYVDVRKDEMNSTYMKEMKRIENERNQELQQFVESEKERIKQTSNDVLMERIKEVEEDDTSVEKKKEEIRKATDEAIEELTRFVRFLFA